MGVNVAGIHACWGFQAVWMLPDASDLPDSVAVCRRFPRVRKADWAI